MKKKMRGSEAKRLADRIRQARHRALGPARIAERAKQEATHREFLRQQRLAGLVPMVLTSDFNFDDGQRGYTLSQGVRIWVPPGLVHLYERLRIAVPEAEPFTGGRAISSTYTPEIQPEEPEPSFERLPSGY